MLTLVGGDRKVARVVQHRARERGFTPLQAEVLGNIASLEDCWAFRSTLAAASRCSVRTVQRAISRAKELGLLEVYRGGKGEVPPGRKRPLPCGWSHRLTVGRHESGRYLAAVIARTRWRNLMRRIRRERGGRVRRMVRASLNATELQQKRADNKRRLAQWDAENNSSRAGPNRGN